MRQLSQLYLFKNLIQVQGQTITNAGLLTLAHGLSSEPKFMQAYLQCTTANANYSVGDKINFPLFHDYDATTASRRRGVLF